MQQIWSQHQQKKLTPKLYVTDNLQSEILKAKKNDQIILEEPELDEDDQEIQAADGEESNYELTHSESQNEEQGAMFEGELELNEMNFNLIKNSKAFKPQVSSRNRKVFSEIIEPPKPALKVGRTISRRSEEDSWINKQY